MNLKTISVRCIDESGKQILNLYGRYDVARYIDRLDDVSPKFEELQGDIVGKVVEFDLDEEHEAEVRAFLRDIIMSSWNFDAEQYISDFMTDRRKEHLGLFGHYVKMQREMTYPLGATHIINLKSAHFKSEILSAKFSRNNTTQLTRLVRQFHDVFNDEKRYPTKRQRREDPSVSAMIEESLE